MIPISDFHVWRVTGLSRDEILARSAPSPNERRLAKRRVWYAENRERLLQYKRRWVATHRDRIKIYRQREYRRRRVKRHRLRRRRRAQQLRRAAARQARNQPRGSGSPFAGTVEKPPEIQRKTSEKG